MSGSIQPCGASHLINQFGRFSLRHLRSRGIGSASLLAERSQVGTLGIRHRIGSGHPVLGIFLQLFGHGDLPLLPGFNGKACKVFLFCSIVRSYSCSGASCAIYVWFEPKSTVCVSGSGGSAVKSCSYGELGPRRRPPKCFCTTCWRRLTGCGNSESGSSWRKRADCLASSAAPGAHETLAVRPSDPPLVRSPMIRPGTDMADDHLSRKGQPAPGHEDVRIFNLAGEEKDWSVVRVPRSASGV